MSDLLPYIQLGLTLVAAVAAVAAGRMSALAEDKARLAASRSETARAELVMLSAHIEQVISRLPKRRARRAATESGQ